MNKNKLLLHVLLTATFGLAMLTVEASKAKPTRVPLVKH